MTLHTPFARLLVDGFGEWDPSTHRCETAHAQYVTPYHFEANQASIRKSSKIRMKSPRRDVTRSSLGTDNTPPPFLGSFASHTPRHHIGCLTPCKVIILCPPMDFLRLRPLSPNQLIPHCSGVGVGGWLAGSKVCALNGLQVKRKAQPQIGVCQWSSVGPSVGRMFHHWTTDCFCGLLVPHCFQL